MLTHPRDQAQVLLEVQDVSTCQLPEYLLRYQQPLQQIIDWAWQYLCRPHPELGRRGHVCPFAKSALIAGGFFLAVRPGRPDGPDEVVELLRLYREWFSELAPREGPASQLKTILVLFPDLPRADWPSIIDGSQRLLKSDYVSNGLMIGEFHSGPPDRPGLWSKDFRPLHSPVPLLAIRHMVPTDLAFLESDAQHLSAYLARFGDHVPAALRPMLDAALTRFGLAPPLATASQSTGMAGVSND